jgi:hypothetical protein
MPVCSRKIGQVPTLLVPDSVVLGCQMKEEADHFHVPLWLRQVPSTMSSRGRIYLRQLKAELPEVAKFEMNVAKSLSTAGDRRYGLDDRRVRNSRRLLPR